MSTALMKWPSSPSMWSPQKGGWTFYRADGFPRMNVLREEDGKWETSDLASEVGQDHIYLILLVRRESQGLPRFKKRGDEYTRPRPGRNWSIGWLSLETTFSEWSLD